MNRGSFIGGIICLSLAALLAILNARLPEGEVMFMINGVNSPVVPIIILAVVGLALLAGAFVRPRGRRG